MWKNINIGFHSTSDLKIYLINSFKLGNEDADSAVYWHYPDYAMPKQNCLILNKTYNCDVNVKFFLAHKVIFKCCICIQLTRMNDLLNQF